MRVTVWGSGAIGGSVGAFLARAGHQVILVDQDAAHVAAIQARGLVLDGSRGDLRVPVPARLPGEMEGPLELVLLCVKAQHTRAAVEQVEPLLARRGLVVSLQNGLNHETIADVVGAERTIPAFVNFAADLVGPGHIRFGGDAPIYVGELDGRLSPRLRELASLLEDFGPTVVTDNVVGYLWAKLALISILFGTALVDADVADVLDHEPGRTLLGGAARETLAVARAAGVRPEPFAEFDPRGFEAGPAALSAAVDAVAGRFRGMLKTRSGYWRDLAVRKRRTEVDFQVGIVVQRGQELGVPVPINRGIQRLIHEIEEGRRLQSWDNLQELVGEAAAALTQRG